MQVLKFGGTSVGSVENMINVADIINTTTKKIVVLSAMSGTTNALVSIAESIKNTEVLSANHQIQVLYDIYKATCKQLLSNTEFYKGVLKYIELTFENLSSLTRKAYSEQLYNQIVSQGELLSTQLFNAYCNSKKINSIVLPALDFMRIDRSQEPDSFYIKKNLERALNQLPETDVYITQGFICLDALGNVSNFKRGGSDYTATIIGSAVNAEEVQIWTDIDGVHNNDPRFVQNTTPISDLSYDESAELAYFGAKILHPQTVLPVRLQQIPVRLKNTMAPKAYGTLITQNSKGDGIKAIAAKDGITAIKIKSARMLLAHGFLKKVFEIFDRLETAIDMITTSEVAISLTIDNDENLTSILKELREFCFVEVEEHHSIICLVGHAIVDHPDTHKLFQILQDINVRMISYGGSKNNISLLVNTSDKVETLSKLHRYIFE
ncbi:MAG: aspartate kinase [Bacteroidetes bacterium MedPE-SWsnd-G2]|nr:MAG: aspartate kinase [Bacteroidetes bacterium MedPE-SWsnd-G2]